MNPILKISLVSILFFNSINFFTQIDSRKENFIYRGDTIQYEIKISNSTLFFVTLVGSNIYATGEKKNEVFNFEILTFDSKGHLLIGVVYDLGIRKRLKYYNGKAPWKEIEIDLNGDAHGQFIMFHNNSRVWIIRHFKSGTQDGLEFYFNRKGRLNMLISYDNGYVQNKIIVKKKDNIFKIMKEIEGGR